MENGRPPPDDRFAEPAATVPGICLAHPAYPRPRAASLARLKADVLAELTLGQRPATSWSNPRGVDPVWWLLKQGDYYGF